MKPQKKAAVYIDGFNIYHFLANKQKSKWINYRELSKKLLPKTCDIILIKHFTAFATWDNEKVTKHKRFNRALENEDIEIRISKFQQKDKRVIVEDYEGRKEYTFFGRRFKGRIQKGYTHEEKKTDVDIGVQLYADASKDVYDVALLISGDTDYEPALTAIVKDFPHKRIIVAIPNMRIPHSIKSIIGKQNCRLIKNKHINTSRFPDIVELKDGNKIECPENW